MISATAGVLAASLALLAPTAGLAPHAIDPEQNNSNYALTEVVHNKTSQTLTISSLRVDDGATIQDHASSVAPGGDLTITATNHGNGVQMWLTVVADDGVNISSDFNIPKVDINSVHGKITNSPSPKPIYFSDVDAPATGKKVTMTYTVVDTSACNTWSYSCQSSF